MLVYFFYFEGVNNLPCGISRSSLCGYGEPIFIVGILTDNWGDETAWWLKERNTHGSFDTMISRDMQLPNNMYSEKQVCINNSKCYKFKIRNEGIMESTVVKMVMAGIKSKLMVSFLDTFLLHTI